ncbi:MAG TPA: hypothetical protein DEA62_03570, partial [Coxiellaceae bacterium]|nr:hypothetical protein [Coxiellaceae bacterium]
MQNDVTALNNHFDAFLEHCGDLLIYVDLKFKIVMINSTAEVILNMSKNEVIGQNLFEICKCNQMELSFTEEDLERSKKLKSEFVDGYIIYSQGQRRVMLWKQIFVNNQQKSYGYFLIFGKDVSLLENSKKKDSILTSACLNNVIIENLPEYIYWKDLSFTYCGCNKHVSDYLGLSSPKDIVGRTDRDFGWPEDRVETLYKIDKKIIETGIPSIVEDIIPRPDKSERIMLSSKTPLRDDNNNIIGIVGVSVDITAEKEAERLRLEVELNKTKLHEQEKFRKNANQVAHDIRSPLTSLAIIAESCKHIPEADRITLRKIAASIGDIANNLSTRYKPDDPQTHTAGQIVQLIPVSLALSEILSEKKYQYKHSSVKFVYFCEKDANFAFIKVEPIEFKRMISNLVNNAVEAFEGKTCKVDLELKLDDKFVEIIIKDNGKGIPKDILDKIMCNIPVTSGKKDGSGIGLTQVCDTLQRNHGKLSIDSKIGKGAKITLAFPKVETPVWIAEKIKLNKGDTIVVLDDDESIHHAWEARLEPYKSDLKLKHFTSGKGTIDFINASVAKDKIFLLSDFELINQDLNGLQVIEQTSMYESSILVTSHYADQSVHNLAIRVGIKILPKQLASEVPIEIEENRSVSGDFKKVGLVIIDDNELLVDSLVDFFQNKDVVVDAYYKPKNFLDRLSQYAKDTKICM